MKTCFKILTLTNDAIVFMFKLTSLSKFRYKDSGSITTCNNERETYTTTNFTTFEL